MEIKLLQKETDAWDSFVYAHEKASIYHLSAWRSVIENAFGHGTHYLYTTNRNNDVSGILPLVQIKSALFGNYMVSMPFFNYGGILAASYEAKKALLAGAETLAREKGASHIEFRDVLDDADFGDEVRTDKVSMRLSLPEGEEELWSNIGSKLRAQIKRPAREGVRVSVGGIELLDEFYEVFSRNMRDLGTPVYSRKFFEEIFMCISDACRIVISRKGDLPVAAGFLIGYRGMMEIPWASSLREYNRLGVNMCMYWEALKYSVNQGFKQFDFGRSSVDSGTYKFKKQWGAKPIQLHWHYWLKSGQAIPMMNPSNPKYKLAIDMWQKLPLPIANYLGPMIVKNLP